MGSQPFRPVSELLTSPVDRNREDELVREILERYDAGEERPGKRITTALRPPPRALWAVASCAVVALVVIGATLWFLYRDGHDAEELRLVSGGAVTTIANASTNETPRIFDLDDGSSVELWPGAELRATKNTGSALEIAMGRGRARFRVEPGGPRIWRVDAGIASVEVLGTSFQIERDEEGVTVSVTRGQVLVESRFREEESRVLSSGQQLFIASGVDTQESRTGETSQASASDAQAPETNSDSSAPTSTWRAFAQEGDFRGAWNSLGEDGFRQRVDGAETMAELIELADVARLSGHPNDALLPLELGIERFSSDPRASVVAFTMGRIEADSLGRHRRAASAFARCLELGPPEALREVAHGRLAESHASAGDYGAARAAAREYLRRYPDGSRSGELRRWVEED